MPMPPETDVFEPIVRGVAQSGVRVANERAVLTLIAGIPGVSNADIARRSGLGPQTTARILSDLEARDLVMRGDVLRGRRGQPATPYRLNPQAGFSIGVEIGWNHTEVLLQNITGRPLAAVRRAHAFPDPDTVFPLLASEIGSMVAGLSPDERPRLIGIGISTPGAFGPLLMRLGASPAQLYAWANIDIAARLAHETGLPTSWFNTGSAAAWCELTSRPPPRPKGFAAFFIGTFVGGGIVAGGELMHGPYGNAADLGAIVVADGSGHPDFLHLRASIHALRRRLGDGPIDWNETNPEIVAWLDEAGHALAQAIATTTAMTEIDIAVINGDLPPRIVERLIDHTQRHLSALPQLLPRLPTLAAAISGASAPALGAARLILFHQYFSRAWQLFHAEAEK